MRRTWTYNLSKIPDFGNNTTVTTDPFLEDYWSYSLLLNKTNVLETFLAVHEYINIYSGHLDYYTPNG
jgi:hypothetical protein